MDGFFMHSRNLLQQTARDKRLTAADRQILDVAMLNTRKPGDSVGLGIDFLVSGTGLDRSTVIRSRRRLEELGYLIPDGKGQRGLFLFTVPTGGVDATPEQPRGGTDATCRTDATGTGGVDATHIDTGYIETTTYPRNNEKPPRCSSAANDPQAPNSEDKPKGESFPQGNKPPPPTPSPPSASMKTKARVTMDDSGFVIPDALRQTWATAYPDVDIERAAAKAFAWCRSNPRKAPKSDYGRFLNGWLGRVKPSDPEYIDAGEQAAGDAELIRGAEMAFDDPDERADYWWRCKQRGEYVPSGVECHPMPAEKEVAV